MRRVRSTSAIHQRKAHHISPLRHSTPHPYLLTDLIRSSRRPTITEPPPERQLVSSSVYCDQPHHRRYNIHHKPALHLAHSILDINRHNGCRPHHAHYPGRPAISPFLPSAALSAQPVVSNLSRPSDFAHQHTRIYKPRLHFVKPRLAESLSTSASSPPHVHACSSPSQPVSFQGSEQVYG